MIWQLGRYLLSLGDFWGIKGTRSGATALKKGTDPLGTFIGAWNLSGEFSACFPWAGDPPWVNGRSMIAPQNKGTFNNVSHASGENSCAHIKTISSSTLAVQHSRTAGMFLALLATAGESSEMPSRPIPMNVPEYGNSGRSESVQAKIPSSEREKYLCYHVPGRSFCHLGKGHRA